MASRDRLDLNILHDRNPLFVQLSDGSIRNGYQLKILNMVNRPRRFEVRVEGLANAGLKLSGGDAEQPTLVIDVAADELHSEQLFIRLDPADLGDAPMQFDIIINDLDGPETARETVRFEQPNRS